MTWEALSAISAAVSALVVTIAAVAAFLQLRHLRRASQVEAVFEAATTPTVDHRIIAVGVHYQMAARLFNRRILDELLFAPYIGTAPGIWKALRPLAHVVRARTGATYWIDIEYFVWRVERTKPLTKSIKREYPAEFLAESGLAVLPMVTGANAPGGA